MVKHIIVWKLKPVAEGEREVTKSVIKRELEGLKDKVPGIVEIKVHTAGLESSNFDLMLDSTFVDEAALKGYTVHPEHVAVATTYVRPNVEIRACFDYVCE